MYYLVYSFALFFKGWQATACKGQIETPMFYGWRSRMAFTFLWVVNKQTQKNRQLGSQVVHKKPKIFYLVLDINHFRDMTAAFLH